MINAYELRLMNLVEYNGEYYRIFGLPWNFVIDHLIHREDDKDLQNIHTKDLNPIPLTEEILLKAGFEKKVTECKDFRVDITHYQKDKHYVYLIPDGFEFEYETGHGRVNLCKVKKYVHELQNLYFALTGEELKIDL